MAPTPESEPANARRGVLQWLGVLVRGAAMGIAEVVPGVSGGTIAFVSGIYSELLGSIARFNFDSARVLVRDGPVAFWYSHNLGFLMVLGAGMGLAAWAFAHLINHWLEVVPTLVWGFFFGVICAAIVQMALARPLRVLASAGLLGVALGWLLTQLDPFGAPDDWWVFCFAGMLAVSAWLLPGISGSFLLLVLGLYEDVLRAVAETDVIVLASLAGGCIVGLMLFSRMLSWLLERAKEPLLCLLTGFMAGALVRLWPWQQDAALLSPVGFQQQTGLEPRLPLTLLAMVLGGIAIWLMNRLSPTATA